MTANHGKVMAPQKDMCKQNERNFWSNSVFLVLLISLCYIVARAHLEWGQGSAYESWGRAFYVILDLYGAFPPLLDARLVVI